MDGLSTYPCILQLKVRSLADSKRQTAMLVFCLSTYLLFSQCHYLSCPRLYLYSYVPGTKGIIHSTCPHQLYRCTGPLFGLHRVLFLLLTILQPATYSGVPSLGPGALQGPSAACHLGGPPTGSPLPPIIALHLCTFGWCHATPVRRAGQVSGIRAAVCKMMPIRAMANIATLSVDCSCDTARPRRHESP